MAHMPNINWSDPRAEITKHFRVHEACWLPAWRTHYLPVGKETGNLIAVCYLMEMIREHLGNHDIYVHSMIRPEAYNEHVGGRPDSMHIPGLACDFHVSEVSCDEVREELVPMLSVWGFRMERNPRASWIHVDLKSCANSKRYFKP